MRSVLNKWDRSGWRAKWAPAAWALGGLLIVTPLLAAQTVAPVPVKPAAKPATSKPATSKPAASSGVDTVVALLKGGMSEGLVIKTLQREGKAYTLATADLLKLQAAGASEAVINALSEPGSVAEPAAVAAGSASGATPFPPDLADVPAGKKRRLAVRPFDYSTVMNWVTYWFKNDMNIGEGIRAMLTVRMNQSKNITLLERTNIQDLMSEQDFGATNRVRKGSSARIGQLSGADAMLYGDIVIFGRDDTSKRKGIGAALGRFVPLAGALVTMSKEEKAVVGINLRLVDTETGEVIETAEARGESSRKSKDYGALIGIGGVGGAAGGGGMTSSNFQQTIIGEATSNAVTKVVEFLEGRIPQLPPKPRDVEGRIATMGTGTAVLNIGSQDGVIRGDRFEILQINGEVRDPVSKEVIDVDAVKIGEFVADGVREKTVSGAYGGQALSAAYLSTAGKGYAARLISK